ncbi:histidine phosphatase family protein [Candidatus Woesearchaeota archaeon]|nr:histidine phosphatase family protein [Candidatus Woesearchaeota archaeon]
MKIFLIRHGETVDNVSGRIQGWSGGTLTSRGVMQARLVGEYLKNIPCSYLYTSDLRRCTQTTEQMVRSLPNIIVQKTLLLRERNWGIMQGKMYPDLVKLLQKHHQAYHVYTPSKAEPWEQFLKRIFVCLKNIIKKHQKESAVIIVTSGGVSSVLIGMLLGKKFKNALALKQTQACINILNCAGRKITVEKKNYTGHLLGIKSKRRTPYI